VLASARRVRNEPPVSTSEDGAVLEVRIDAAVPPFGAADSPDNFFVEPETEPDFSEPLLLMMDDAEVLLFSSLYSCSLSARRARNSASRWDV
jgi:hypothetical protein